MNGYVMWRFIIGFVLIIMSAGTAILIGFFMDPVNPMVSADIIQSLLKWIGCLGLAGGFTIAFGIDALEHNMTKKENGE